MKTYRFNLVMPLDVWKRIKKLAEREHRSVTQQIVVAIIAALETAGL